MPAIMHRVEIDCELDALYRAFTTSEGITSWWSAATVKKDELTVDFGGGHSVRFAVEENVKKARVVWKCVEGPWVNTEQFLMTLGTSDSGRSFVEFAHTGWETPDAFFMHCNSKWGFFLTVSLKDYLEKGEGTPHPHEPNI